MVILRKVNFLSDHCRLSPEILQRVKIVATGSVMTIRSSFISWGKPAIAHLRIKREALHIVQENVRKMVVRGN